MRTAWAVELRSPKELPSSTDAGLDCQEISWSCSCNDAQWTPRHQTNFMLLLLGCTAGKSRGKAAETENEIPGKVPRGSNGT